MPAVEVKRRMGEQDIAEVAALLADATAADGHAPLGEHKWLDLVEGGREGFAGFVAREPGHERVVGYAQLSRGGRSWAVEAVVHPDYRNPDLEIATDLLQTALGEIAAQGGGRVYYWIPKADEDDEAVARAIGMTRGRQLYQMRRRFPLEAELTAGAAVSTRPFRVGVDEADWLVVNARAFAALPDQGAWDLHTLEDRERQPWFDEEGFLLHDEDGRLGAFCWTKVREEAHRRVGEIYVIGVDPSLQGRGLGKKMVIAGLGHIAKLGIDEAMLYVDADNTAAVGLYHALGFQVDHRDVAYVKDVAAR